MAKSEYRRLEKLLKDEGYEEVKVRGGHRQFKHPVYHNKISLTKEVTKNIEKSIERQIRKAKNESKKDG